jgi:hypothetical protein
MAGEGIGRAFVLLKRDGTVKFKPHPELVSGSIFSLNPSVRVARWMLERQSPEVKEVQHDFGGLIQR